LKSCRDDVSSTKLHIALDKQFFIRTAKGRGRGRQRDGDYTLYMVDLLPTDELIY